MVVILLGAKGLNWYLFFGLVELAIVIVLSNILLRSKHIGWFVNSILLLLLNTQMVFLLLSNSYIVLIFLDNMIRSPKVGKSRLRQLNNACSLTTEYSL